MPSTTHRFAILALPWCLAGSAASAPARAETYQTCAGFIDSVPATIATQGTWCLRQDLSTAISSGAAITVATNNVTLDCNRFKLGGLAAGIGTSATGVEAPGRLNVTVRNCTIRGFQRGVDLSGGGHALLDSRLDQNTWIGARLSGSGTRVEGNQVLDTGGSPAYSYNVGLWLYDGVRVVDNQVIGVGHDGDGNLEAIGILTYALTGTVARNSVSDVRGHGSLGSYGISNQHSPSRLVIRDNDIAFVPQATIGYAIRCNGGSVVKDNVAYGHANGLTASCVDGGGNVVLP